MAAPVMNYVVFCPLGDGCKFKNARLAKFDDIDKCKLKLYNHLRWSPSHMLSEDETQSWIAIHDFVEEEADPVFTTVDTGGSDGKGAATCTAVAARPKNAQHWKQQGQQGQHDGGGSSSAWKPQAWANDAWTVAVQEQEPQNENHETLESLVRCHAAATAAAKLARSAAVAFEDEASIMQSHILKLRKTLDRK